MASVVSLVTIIMNEVLLLEGWFVPSNFIVLFRGWVWLGKDTTLQRGEDSRQYEQEESMDCDTYANCY
jgi:hypothetical protein